MNKINGYIVAPFTPMLDNGDLNLELISEYSDFIKRNGPDGVFICGSTGKGALLSLEERMAVASKWIEVSHEELKVIVHTGGTNVTDQQKTCCSCPANWCLGNCSYGSGLFTT